MVMMFRARRLKRFLLACVLLVAALNLLKAARTTDQFQTSKGTIEITPIYHGSLMIRGAGTVIYVDPWSRGDYSGLPKADLILVTDIHGDHCDPEMINQLRKPGTTIMGPGAVAEKLKDQVKVEVISNGERRRFGEWEMEAVPMYNLKRGPKPGTLFHTKGRGNGYVLTLGDFRVYISGDTEFIPEMKQLHDIDVAFICMNLPYTMPPEEAAEAVKAFRPRIVYPYHYRESDLEVFRKLVEPLGIEVRIRNWY